MLYSDTVNTLTGDQLHQLVTQKMVLKGTLMQIWKSTNISVFIWKKNMLKISHLNIFYFLRYAHVRYVKSLFTNIPK